LLAKLESDIRHDHFVLKIPADGGLDPVDETDTTHQLTVTASEDCPEALPFESSLTRILFPAGRPTLSSVELPTQVSFPGLTDVVLFSGQISYEGPDRLAELSLHAWNGNVYQHAQDGYHLIDAAKIFSSVSLAFDGERVNSQAAFNDGMVTIEPDQNCTIIFGKTIDVSLTAEISKSAPSGNFVLGFADSSFLDLRDQSQGTPVHPVIAGGYPLRGVELSITSPSLESSFSNYPNPFNPALGEETTIAYVLAEDAEIEIEIFTITGESVLMVTAGQHKGTGVHQDERWNGRNGRGLTVVPGTYYCRITARYSDGRVEVARRKVAVIR
jgi:hypothetical protein